MRKNRRHFESVLLIALASLAAQSSWDFFSAQGATTSWTWDGGGSDNLWTTKANWSPKSVPANNGAADLTFAGTTRLAPYMNQNWDVNSIAFGSSAGAFTLGGSGVLTLESSVVNSSGNSQTISSPISLNKPVTFTASSANLIFSGNVANQGNDLTVNGSADTVFQGSISGTGGLIQNGSGETTLSGSSSFTGRIQVNQGTLLLGASDRIGNTTPMTLAGGTFDTGGYSETLGSLTLSANSRIDLGDGSSILHFASSQNNVWTSGSTLVIEDWSGNRNGGGTDQIYFGSLTSSQISQIYFLDPAGFAPGLYPSMLIPSTLELVPVPEPSMAGVIAALGLFVGFCERKVLAGSAREFFRRARRIR